MRGALAGMLEAARAFAAQNKPDPRAPPVWNRAGTGRDRRAGRQTELVAMCLPPRTAPSSPSSRRAANVWSRGPAAVSAPISGRNLWPVPLISFATPNMPTAPATASSRPACVAGSAPARTSHAGNPVGLCRASRSSPRRTHGSHAGARGRRQAPAHRQEDPPAHVRLRHQPGHSGGQ